jgi:Zn-dependent protease with chaperone function
MSGGAWAAALLSSSRQLPRFDVVSVIFLIRKAKRMRMRMSRPSCPFDSILNNGLVAAVTDGNTPHTLDSRPSIAYQAGLFFVTAGMIILPIVYLALTAATCWGVYYFAVHCFPAIWDWPIGRSYYGLIIKVIASVTPLLVGGAIAIAMVKPLFARRASPMQPLALDPAIEPRVYALVARVCEMVGAPAPRRIEVDCDLNASARLNRGLLNFFRHDLILTLGMPLVAGLTERELAGVIAHEFGHFRQPTGMRLTYLIRRVNHWFARVVYERDGWDDAIESAASSADGWIAFMIVCARAGVGVSRGVLWSLMMVGHGLSGFLLRQMEYDADQWEIRVAGSEKFESTMLRIASLAAVREEIHREMRRTWRRTLQLPDNLPVLIEFRASRMSDDRRAKAENAVGLEKTGWFDTHPSPADRVRRARQIASPGLVEGDAPAKGLFENFDTISRLVTLAHYEDDLNVPIEPDFLIPLEKLVRAQTEPAPAAPAPAPVPMMAYNPAAFSREKPADRSETGE